MVVKADAVADVLTDTEDGDDGDSQDGDEGSLRICEIRGWRTKKRRKGHEPGSDGVIEREPHDTPAPPWEGTERRDEGGKDRAASSKARPGDALSPSRSPGYGALRASPRIDRPDVTARHPCHLTATSPVGAPGRAPSRTTARR